MFCSKCGADNSETAVYCQKCGAQVGDEVETKVAAKSRDLPDQPEKEIFALRPTLKFIQLGYAAAVISAFLLVVILNVFLPVIGLWIWWIPIIAGLALLLIPAYYHIKRNIIKYRLTDSKVEISDGLLTTNTRNVPLRTIQDVAVRANVYQRLVGIGDVVIENANESDTDIIFKNINSPKKYADILLDQMRESDR